VLAFVAVLAGLLGLRDLLATLLRGDPAARGRPARRRLALAGALAARVGAGVPLGLRDDLDGRIAGAGLAGVPGVDPRSVLATKVGGCLTGAAIALPAAVVLPGRLGLMLLMLMPAAGFLAPDLWLRRLGSRRANRMRREIPAILDLLRVTTSAGASLPAALRRVAENSSGALARELRAVTAQVALGAPIDSALARLEATAGCPEVEALAAALRRASRHGTPLAETLAAQARDARARHAQEIREEAARAGPKIQLVVALLLVPSVLLVVGAALARAFLGPGAPLQLL
jgi:tight adherence protein C